MKSKVEILAPAGNPEAFRSAWAAGADAVYLGLTRFNARQGAANFDEDAFRAAVAACHERGVAVHVTLNTLAGQGELPDLLDAAALAEVQLVNCDAFVLAVKHFSRPGAYAKTGAVALAVSSVSATEGWAGGTAYCASKGALSAACRALDRELAAKKIRVKAIEPNHVLTDMFRKGAGRMGVPESAARSPESLAQEILEMIEDR